MNDEVVGEAATELLDMRANRRVVPDLPVPLRPETLIDAYAIQLRVVAALVAQAGGADCLEGLFGVGLLVPAGGAALLSTRVHGVAASTDGALRCRGSGDRGSMVSWRVTSPAGGVTTDRVAAG